MLIVPPAELIDGWSIVAGAALAVMVAVDVAVMLLLAVSVIDPPAVFGVALWAACAA